MQTPKKRKRDLVEVEYPRITYDAPTRTFERLFKEHSLDGMKDVVRKKLGLATSAPILLSQVRDGKSIDLEDDDDFDAFHSFAQVTDAVQVNIVVGSDTPTAVPRQDGDSEVLQSTRKKKKRKSITTELPLVASSSLTVDSPPPKRRRVSFAELPADHPEENVVDVPVTPGKKKRNHVADSSASIELANEAPHNTPSKSTLLHGTEKKKPKKSTPSLTSEELAPSHPVPDTPSTKKSKKRRRESTGEGTSEVVAPSQPQQVDSLAAQVDDAPRTTKTSKKAKVTIAESAPPQNSRSKSVPPSSMQQKPIPAVLASAEPEVSVEQKKTSRKGKERAVSESPSATPPDSPELVLHDEGSSEKKKRGKSKAKVASIDPEVNKTKDKGKEKPLSEPVIPVAKKTKVAETPQAVVSTPNGTTSENDKDVNGPGEKKNSRKNRLVVEITKPSKSSKALDKSRLSDDPQALRAAALEAIQAVLARKGVTFAQIVTPQVDEHSSVLSHEEEEPTEPTSICRLCDASPAHEAPLCPVMKGGVRAMRKRVAQLEKDTSGDETKQAERQEVITELQAIIQKRARKPKTLNVVNGASTEAKKAAVNGEPLPAAPAPIAVATKPSKQVDVVSPHMPVVDVEPPIASSQPVKPTSSVAKPLKPVQQSSPLQPPHSRQPLSSQKSVTKTNITEKLIAKLPLANPECLGNLPLDQVTDNDLLSIIHGPKLSVADMPSSEEGQEEEEEEEEPILEDDEREPKRRSQGSTRLEYPSSSDAGDEDDNSEGSIKRNDPSLSTEEEEDQNENRHSSEDSSHLGEGDTSLGDVAANNSKEIDNTGDDVAEAAPEEDFGTSKTALTINGRPKTTEADSDTAVGSQNEELFDLRLKEKKSEVTAAGADADPIEASAPPDKERTEQISSSDDHLQVQPAPKAESTIRTRSQRRKEADQQEDNDQVPKNVRKTRKVTELPIPSPARLTKSSSLAPGVRRNKAGLQQEEASGGGDEDDRPSKPSMNGKVGSKTPIKDAKIPPNTRSNAGTSETVKGKGSTKPASRSSVASASGSKPKSRLKIKPMEPIDLANAINQVSAENKKLDEIVGSQTQETHVSETPADEQLPDVTTPADFSAQRSQDAGPSGESLFIPSETQQSFPYSQFPEIFASPRREEAPESEDENEVLASVVKAKPQQRTYRGLSQMGGSEKFARPSFQTAGQGKAKEPESIYGRSHHNVVSDTESDSESDEDTPVSSHIPAYRLAGAL